MISKSYFSISTVIVLMAMLTSVSFAQDVVTLEPYNVNQQFLVDQIAADTAANDGVIPEGRIYELIGGEVYLNTSILFIEDYETLHVRSSNDEKAIIYQYPTGSGDNPNNPPGNLFISRGGDIILDGLAVTGYYEPGDDLSEEEFDELYTVQGGLLRTNQEGASIIVTNSIFSNVAGQILRTEGSTVKIHFEDVVFANLGALSTSNFGAGKGIDLREASVDSLIMINNTFVNYQDRPIRHYNFGNPEAGTGAIGYGLFDHNTFVNGMGFHGVLSLGTVGDKIEITNNLFVDAFASGEDPTDDTRTAEWANTGEQYDNGNNRMAWIFANPNETTEWVIENNYFAVTAEGQNFLDSYEELSVGEPLSIHIRERLGDSADDAFTQIDDPGLTNVPDLMIGLMTYYIEVAEKTKDTPNDYWNPATEDMDRRPITYYVNDFDASYSTSSAAYTGATDGFPVGDLNWFPAIKEDWVSTSSEIIAGDIPTTISLKQNYPNPFNPATTIQYDLATASNVQIDVFDMLGRKVATLVNNDFQQAGTYRVNFDASNLSSGIYIYMLKAGDISQTKRMTLIK
ncbi:T9SS C-terminal target domain-containing protein [Rhodohalobacter sp. SW132]|uniref:T9SS type A sorting domain-containing protein n=1 Tax=Rhodohalobacter sp. SW132 TaxID=2293433 RepID=UPI000E26F293|nr:T9SS type A sorting domain-containing protein [Rhodohalobacter sp. SW132]REL33483.1 T9SS C-terminal target domain-containing protein [Rhodohalobacter sp. SW132]